MHCKFWCFSYCFLFLIFFFFFLRACEFRFIERIGAHGKQNPGFIIIIIIDTVRQDSNLLYFLVLTYLMSHAVTD